MQMRILQHQVVCAYWKYNLFGWDASKVTGTVAPSTLTGQWIIPEGKEKKGGKWGKEVSQFTIREKIFALPASTTDEKNQ